MEQLKYIIEDSTIARLLGEENFTNAESAILELVKNAYDANATLLNLTFDKNQLIITDNGNGMNSDDIKTHWMHIGKSDKGYEVLDNKNNKRILAGSKGIGRFALSRLGEDVILHSKKDTCLGIVWKTDWNKSQLDYDNSHCEKGTKIIIKNLREKWTKKRIENLCVFLSKTYNDDLMKIEISYLDINLVVSKYFPEPNLGQNCKSYIKLKYNSDNCNLFTCIESDEFLDKAKKYCPQINLKYFTSNINIVDELKLLKNFDFSNEEIKQYLQKLGNFSAEFYFNFNTTSFDMEKFLYKYSKLPYINKSGIILYRNSFSITTFEGKKDWLGLGKRTRKSPAAASHPTGSWRVRENQLSGKINIDKKINFVLQDLSNRQGLDENIYYELFIEIITTGIKVFERYRQSIIRLIDVKNDDRNKKQTTTPLSDKVSSNPSIIPKLSTEETKQLADEIKSYRKQSKNFKKEKEDIEDRHRYDVRILNVLATTGLKASSIAHEMRNDRNSISDISENIKLALEDYGMWDELNTQEKKEISYKNVPYLIELNKDVNKKVITFMDTMLSEIQKKQFEGKWQSITDLLRTIKTVWERDYARIKININIADDICFAVSEDVIKVIFDNLILNSIQQNEKNLVINISAELYDEYINFVYSDDGKGLDKKYHSNSRQILEVHETTRKNGHGLGMWIVNNTIVMSGGEIKNINGQKGFSIEFSLGGKIYGKL